MDKDNAHIDSEFIDHSWREMSNLLDQEMPVKQRKKRVLWIWFFGLGLLGLIGWSYLIKKNNRNINSFNIPEEKIAYKKIPKTSPTSIELKKVSKEQATRKSSDNFQVISTIKNVTKTPSPIVNTSTTEGVGTPKAEIPTTQHSPSSITKKDNLLQNTAEYTSKKISPELPVLSNLPTELLEYNDNLPVTFIIPVKDYNNRWRFGLYASALTPKIGSFSLGFHTNLSLTKKWQLHLGLGYGKKISPSSNKASTENQDVTSAIPAMEAEDMNTTAGTSPAPTTDPSTNGMDLISNASISYTNFHYFEAPLLVQYTLHPRFTIEVGGSFSYLYGYRYQNQEGSFFTNNSTFGNTQGQGVRSADLTIVDIPTVPTTNWAIIGGANYQLTKQLNTYLNYHYSTPYLKATSTHSPKRWQQIEVGIRYYFK